MIGVSALGFLAIFVMLLVAFFSFVSTVALRMGGWTKAYRNLGKRYGARISWSLGRPRMSFNYGGKFSELRNTSSRFRKNKRTQLTVRWDNRRLKLFVSSLGSGNFRTMWGMSPVAIDCFRTEPEFGIQTNMPEMAEQMLTPTTKWRIQQLHQHGSVPGIEISIRNGVFTVSKPGYIKDFQVLDDFVRFGLELFDQFILTYNQDIEFVSEQAPVIVADVKCPICSERIDEAMVVCVRCKTPHCADCWEYNGQCATFACGETRAFGTGSEGQSKALPT